jgi:hypothetical protein
MELADKFQAEGNTFMAVDLLETLSQKKTTVGQGIEILKAWSKLKPIGAVDYASKQVKKSATPEQVTKAKEFSTKTFFSRRALTC